MQLVAHAKFSKPKKKKEEDEEENKNVVFILFGETFFFNVNFETLGWEIDDKFFYFPWV